MSAMKRWNSIFPSDKHGDNYDRYLMRMEEMRQSVRIMKPMHHQTARA